MTGVWSGDVEPPRPRSAHGSSHSGGAPAGAARAPTWSDLQEIREVLDRRGAEIDVIQGEKKRWFRDPILIVAVLALVVSVLSAWVSQANHDSDQANQDRQRLTTVLDDLTKNGSENNISIDALRPELNEAKFLIERASISSSPYEKIVVAQGFLRANEPAIAAELASSAENEARAAGGPLTDETDSARNLARAQFQSNQVDAGRATYKRAVDYAVNAPPTYSGYLRTLAIVNTYERWPVFELEAGNCQEAEAVLTNLYASVRLLPKAYQESHFTTAKNLSSDFQTDCGRPPAVG